LKGVQAPIFCNFTTPYDIDTRGSIPFTFVDGYSAVFSDDFGPSDSFVGGFMESPSQGVGSRGRYVKWSLVKVPEPSTSSLLLLVFIFAASNQIKQRIKFTFWE